jgi:HK97 family phage prohead protease
MLTPELKQLAFKTFVDKHSRVQTYRERRDLPLELVDLKVQQAKKDDPFEFEGYGSVWDRVDSYGDTVLKGAFAESLKARRPMMFFGHSPGRVPGKWVKAQEDDTGLFLRGQLTPGHSEAVDLEASLRHQSLSGLSIGGYTTEAEWIEEDSKIVGRRIKAFELFEVSVVSMPAENEARVDGNSIKSVLDQCETIRDFEDLLREVAGFSSSSATAFVARMRRISRGEPVESPAASKTVDELVAVLRSNPIPQSLTGS